MNEKKMIATITCQDRVGIVAKITTCLSESGSFISISDHFSDPETNQFFYRLVFEKTNTAREHLQQLAKREGWDLSMQDADYKTRALILVSKQSHCLTDLLQKSREGRLQLEPVAICSNHKDLEEIAAWYQIPFHHLPITKENRDEQEKVLLNLIEKEKIDLCILAKYMQILSPNLCNALRGKAINIHHSLLPSFKGAKPYHQAYAKGVKMIGATAHFVTEDLDEGQIIYQDIIRVNHSHTLQELIRYGADIEGMVLSRAVKYFTGKQILINGNKTVVLRH